MLKTIVKSISLIVLSGFLFGCLFYEQPYETIIVHEHLRAGDTVDKVLEMNYNEKLENRTWMEFRGDNHQRNQWLFRNGRIPQIGDVVCIEIHQKKVEQK